MSQTEPRPHFDQTHQHPFIVTHKALSRIVGGVLLAIIVGAGLWRLARPMTAAYTDAPGGGVAPVAVNFPRSPDPNTVADTQMTNFFAQRRYLTGHANPNYWSSDAASVKEQTEVLLSSLRQGQPVDQRQIALNQLIQAPPSVVPVLLDTLTDPDAGVRSGVAYVLGSQRAPEAEDSLYFSTFDADPSVRRAAVWALGELGTPFILPRLEWLQVAETNPNVSQAARAAEQQIYANIAASLNASPADLRAVTVATASGRLYAATVRALYAPRDLSWGLIAPLPAAPTALAAGGKDGKTLYLGTASAGVFRSLNGGQTWMPINSGLPVGNQFTVSALVANPDDSRQVYATLAKSEAAQVPVTPFGIFRSEDGGDTWMPLTQWNVDYVTTRLVLDSSAPGYLFGLTEAGAWQYPLDAAKPR